MKFQPSTTYTALIHAVNTKPADSPLNVAWFIRFAGLWLKKSSESKDLIGTQRSMLRYLPEYELSVGVITIDDDLPFHLQGWIDQRQPRPVGHGVSRAGAALRTLLNEIGTDEGALQRPLLTYRQHERARRLSVLSRHTQKAIVWYESNAKQIRRNTARVREADGSIGFAKEYRLLKKPLSSYCLNNRLSLLIQVLEELGCRCIKEVGPDTLRNFLASDDATHPERSLKELENFFANMHHAKFLEENPLALVQYVTPEKNRRADFLRLEDARALKEAALATDENTPIQELKDLLLCIFAFDTGLRLRELTALKVADVAIAPGGGPVTITVRGEIQKGQDKWTRLMLLLFPSTRHVLQLYLDKIRPKIAGGSLSLFIGCRGKGISASAVSESMQRTSKAMGIQTFNGNKVTAHIFRHSMATLNVSPLGAKLSIEDIIERLRHDDHTIARRVYIQNNPYINQAKIAIKLEEQRNESTRVWSVPLETLMEWMSSDLLLPAKTCNAIRQAYLDKKGIATVPSSQKGSPANGAVSTMSEQDALTELKRFSITIAQLRELAESQNSARFIRNKWRYAEEWIWGLKNDYVSLGDAADKLTISKQTIYNRRTEFKLLKIGRASYVPKHAISQYCGDARRGNGRGPA